MSMRALFFITARPKYTEGPFLISREMIIFQVASAVRFTQAETVRPSFMSSSEAA